jgi:hypothetical protein
VQITAYYFIQSATTGFIANIFPYRNRVSLKEAFEGLEPDEYESLTSGSERAGPQQWGLATRLHEIYIEWSSSGL